MFYSHAAGRTFERTALPLAAIVISEPELQPGFISESDVLQQPRSVLMSLDHITAKGDADAHGLDCCLKPC